MNPKEMILDILPARAYLGLRRQVFRITRPKEFRALQDRRSIVTSDGYSLKPYDDRRAIFVHIPKCGGISINKALFGNLGGGHEPLEQYLLAFEPRAVLEYFKFTFVRNPWDRLVSAYFFLKDGGINEKDRAWARQELGGYSGFEDFVRRWLNRENIWKWYHFIPQHHFMLDKRRRVKLDFVGFIENINDDFAYVARRIGVESGLARFNEGSHRSFTEYYTDELRDIVADVYAEDIALLGYSFDNSSLERQLADRSKTVS